VTHLSHPLTPCLNKIVRQRALSPKLIKLRQLGEFLTKEVAARHGLLPSNAATFDEVLRTLKVRAILPPEVANLFSHLKRVGNAAVHENLGHHSMPREL
jgi:hypothetical protein